MMVGPLLHSFFLSWVDFSILDQIVTLSIPFTMGLQNPKQGDKRLTGSKMQAGLSLTGVNKIPDILSKMVEFCPANVTRQLGARWRKGCSPVLPRATWFQPI